MDQRETIPPEKGVVAAALPDQCKRRGEVPKSHPVPMLPEVPKAKQPKGGARSNGNTNGQGEKGSIRGQQARRRRGADAFPKTSGKRAAKDDVGAGLNLLAAQGAAALVLRQDRLPK
jgi:hypothetical protein